MIRSGPGARAGAHKLKYWWINSIITAQNQIQKIKIRKNCHDGIFRKIRKTEKKSWKFSWKKNWENFGKILRLNFGFLIFQRDIIVFICSFCDMLCIYGTGCLGNLETVYGILLWLFFKLAWPGLLSWYICNCFYAKERSLQSYSRDVQPVLILRLNFELEQIT